MNIIDYIKKHKDEDFKEFLFSEVDNLIFSLLPCIYFKNIVPAFKKNKIKLQEVAYLVREKNNYERGLFIRNTYKMLEVMKDTKRYKDVLLYNYMRVVNEEMQFAALTIQLTDKSIYIAYAGTDTSIIGWEEDFKLAYLYPGFSQKYAAIYLNKALGLFDKIVRVGGHSKGGNLAISAVMRAKPWVRRKVREIYNNDGPGFLKEQVESKVYKKIESKIKMYVPEESIIGMILYHVKDYTVVKARGFGIMQHDAFHWLVNDKGFIQVKQSKRSKRLEVKVTKKLEEMPIEKRIDIVKKVFDVFKNNNIKDTKEIRLKKLFKLMKSFSQLDKETQNALLELIIILFVN